jgi:hypothetical protein
MILDTEQANIEIERLKNQNEQLETIFREEIERMSEHHIIQEEKYKSINQMLQEENTRLLNIIEELQAELNQLKSNA